ncbi:exonuclease domain-containing protein [Nocardiopsis sp. RSe5-2]|uniref:Exonuclease domain-containing protein n=1 Tax=Nocardiopsis endophytica TaxID=3018445 RepID=A0ABT4U096_9ACTN|nr:exonuclease domain-containing protein [Nocardiopsis endophytica]MDA2810370.1 exonuclease domain-containing protein [Nocardiopsis endophytica]
MSDWHLNPMLAFDIESTGVDFDTDRIVSCALIRIDPAAGTAEPQTWLADPGIEIPQGATDVHGITTEFARQHGRPAREVVDEVAQQIGAAVADGVPLVAFNAAYDCTLLDRELARYRIGVDFGGKLRVVDPHVLDKEVDRYRRGSRRLVDVCAHYNIPLAQDAAHGCEADALAAARLAWRLGSTQSRLAAMGIEELHDAQRTWRAQQAASLEEYLRRKNPREVVERAWPIIPATST